RLVARRPGAGRFSGGVRVQESRSERSGEAIVLSQDPASPTATAGYANRSRARAFAFIASTSRLRGVLAVSRLSSRRRAASDTSSTARLNAASLTFEGCAKPLSLRTNCTAEARISSSVAGGSKLNSVRILRHIDCSSDRVGSRGWQPRLTRKNIAASRSTTDASPMIGRDFFNDSGGVTLDIQRVRVLVQNIQRKAPFAASPVTCLIGNNPYGLLQTGDREPGRFKKLMVRPASFFGL